MYKLYNLKDKLCDELTALADEEISTSNIDIIDKLTHTIKNLNKIIDAKEAESYSGAGRYDARGNMSNARGRNSYTGRDSMGRYTYDGYSRTDDIGGMIHEIRSLAGYLPSNKQEDVDRLVMRMEQM